MTETSRSKRCKQCDQMKPLDEFYHNSKMHDGHLNVCKECFKAVQRIYNRTPQAKRSKYESYQKQRSKHGS